MSGVARHSTLLRRSEGELREPQFARPRPDDTASVDADGRAVSASWVGKHRAAIRFHRRRGMSLKQLGQIYGRDTVIAVLGGEL